MSSVETPDTSKNGWAAGRQPQLDGASGQTRVRVAPNSVVDRRRRHSPSRSSIEKQPTDKLPWPVVLFLVGLVVPWVIPIGALNMSVYRIVLVGSVLPCLVLWMRGRAGRIRAADVGLLVLCLWVAISLAVAHGLQSAIEPAGIFLVETMGAYLLARCFIRTRKDFENVVRLWTKLVLLLLPFSLYEWTTGGKPILVAFGSIFPTVEITMMQPRLGFWRVQGPFSHSIEYGLFCGSLLALVFPVVAQGRHIAARLALTGAIAATAFMSMSSAPIAGLIIHSLLIAWNWFLNSIKYRWKILWGLAFASYLVVEFGSNQPPIQFYISHFTFDGQTGWYRLAIWEFGSASVLSHPWLGIGLNEYARPSWMGSGSVDNFWLVNAIRHGIPAVVLIMTSCFWLTWTVAFKKGLDQKLDTYRVAYLICLMSFFFVGCTIHFYGPIYVWFLFFLGSGVWMLDVKPSESTRTESPLAWGRNSTANWNGRNELNTPPSRRRQQVNAGATRPSKDTNVRLG